MSCFQEQGCGKCSNFSHGKNRDVEKTINFHQAFTYCFYDHHRKIDKEINCSFFRGGYALAVTEVLCKTECDQVVKSFFIMQVHRAELGLYQQSQPSLNFLSLSSQLNNAILGSWHVCCIKQ